MVMPAYPATRLVLVQAALPLGRFKTLLDGPVTATHLCQTLQGDLRRRVGAMALHLGLLAQRPTHQQTLASGRQSPFTKPDPQEGVLKVPRPLATFGDDHSLPSLGRQPRHDLIYPLRLGRHTRLRRWPTPLLRPGRDYLRLAQPDAGVGRRIHDVPLAQLTHPLHEGRAVAVDAVRRHPAEGHATLQSLPHHLQTQ